MKLFPAPASEAPPPHGSTLLTMPRTMPSLSRHSGGFFSHSPEPTYGLVWRLNRPEPERSPEPFTRFRFRASEWFVDWFMGKSRMFLLIGKTLLVSFFFILSNLFLNILFSAEEHPVQGGKFVQPVILADYDSGTIITNMGGLSGGDENSPGTLYAAVVNDDGFIAGNSGYGASLDYDVQNLGEYTFYWIKLGKELSAGSGITETLDLKGYDYLSFRIRGDQEIGNIKIELHQDVNADGVFTFGKDAVSYVYINGYVKSGVVNREWSKIIIPLKEFNKVADWSRMIELVFVFENKAGNKKGTVYLDDILFGYAPEDVLYAKETREIKTPVEASFRINGASAKRCPAFKGTNMLSIKAESASENPFIESVRFEYSSDKGNTWRTIGTDYDASRGAYNVDWHPDNSRELLSYQVRAVASDIRGNEKTTGVLIDCGVQPITDDEFLDLLEKKAFEFFRDHQDQRTGLFADTSGGGDASIASTGLGLAALCIGAERKWIHKEEAKRRVLLALNTFLPSSDTGQTAAEGRYGFFYHFLNKHTALRAGKNEISTVDTAILVCGALTAGEYFGGEIRTKAEEIYKAVEWGKFLCMEKGPWYGNFSMGWSPERGFLESYWDFYTDEVMMICLLAAGSPTYPVDPGVFYAWTRQSAPYESGRPFIYSWHGALFSYQYAHMWFDLRGLVDKRGVNWFENSTNATLANRQFCIDNADKFKGYGPNSWGITSMARPQGYTMHFGPPPAGNGEPQYDGTISPTGPAGSIVFTPYLSIVALKYMYVTYPRLWGQYGIKDSFNADLNWYSSTYYGIGAAMILIPIENFRTGLIWKTFMKNKYASYALVKAGFTKVKTTGR